MPADRGIDWLRDSRSAGMSLISRGAATPTPRAYQLAQAPTGISPPRPGRTGPSCRDRRTPTACRARSGRTCPWANRSAESHRSGRWAAGPAPRRLPSRWSLAAARCSAPGRGRAGWIETGVRRIDGRGHRWCRLRIGPREPGEQRKAANENCRGPPY